MKKIVIITGQTCSGKSSLAMKLAREVGGEIISADSVQIYRGLDIGSAKPSAEEMSQVSHHLVDVLDFNETFNVQEFVERCKNAIMEISSHGAIPFIVGGTGLYIKALIEGYTFGAMANDEFRTKYKTMAKTEGNLAVWNELNKINPDRAKSVHPNNIKRVIRYLEIEMLGSKKERDTFLKDYDVLTIGIVEDREKIYSRINSRVDKMIQSGLEDEVRELHKNGAERTYQSMNSIGYKEWFDYFDGVVDYKTTIDLIKQHTRNYCKRQLTFLKTIPSIQLVTVDEAEQKIRAFLKSI